MTLEYLRKLENLNQLRLTDSQEQSFLRFWDDRTADLDKLNEVSTEDVERMVHVMPLVNVVREDKIVKLFTRDELQKSAPEVSDGYWQVPRLVE